MRSSLIDAKINASWVFLFSDGAPVPEDAVAHEVRIMVKVISRFKDVDTMKIFENLR